MRGHPVEGMNMFLLLLLGYWRSTQVVAADVDISTPERKFCQQLAVLNYNFSMTKTCNVISTKRLKGI
jgi:hypothetical protein